MSTPDERVRRSLCEALDRLRAGLCDHRELVHSGPELIVSLRKIEGWEAVLEELQERSETSFGCRFRGMLESQLHRVDSIELLPKLDHRFLLLDCEPGDEIHAINRVLAKHGGPSGAVLAVEPSSSLRFSMPIGLPFALGGQHHSYLERMNVAAAHSRGVAGEGVRVALVDTGSRLDAPDDFYDVLNPNNSHPGAAADSNGHGTVMASLIRSVAPRANLSVVRISNDRSVSLMNAMAGVSVAVLDCHAEVVNLSLGFPGFGVFCEWCGTSVTARSIAFETLLRSLASFRGATPVFVASAGNEAPKQSDFEYPASYDFSLAVGSVNSNGRRSRFSQYRLTGGHKRYLLAPGGETNAAGDVLEHVGSGPGGPCYGTSASAAYVSGLLALFLDSRLARVEGKVNRRHKAARALGRAPFDRGRHRIVSEILATRCRRVPGKAAEYGSGEISFDRN